MSKPAWSPSRGANVAPGGARFSVWAPSVDRVWLELADRPELITMRPEAGGVFGAEAEGVSAGDCYAYRLPGVDLRLPDPVSRHQPQGVHGWSQVVDPGSFEWTDAAWGGMGTEDLVIYELHVGTFTPQGTFASTIERLDYLRQLGVTAIELMPIAQFPGGRNWGYDGVLPYAAQNTYGGPEGFKQLVNAAHRAGLAVLLDVVYNHLGPEGNYLARFGPYFTDRYKTAWGEALNFDGPDSDEVRAYFIENALYWIAEYHVDGLRLDAVHAMYDFSALHILQEIAERAQELGRGLGRRVLMIAESDLNDPRLVRPTQRGGYGLDATWSDDFHHAVHAALTGERAGYYVDFGGVEPIARCVEGRFAFAGRHSRHRRRRHGAPADDVSTDRFVVFIQNHDQVGNRAAGDRLSTMISFEQLKLAAAMNLLSPYVPLLFMGEEYAETNPFQYFVSHGDPQLLAAVRQGRATEFRAFQWQGELPDPGGECTFRRSRLDFDRRRQAPHSQILAMYRALLAIRRETGALRPGDVRISAFYDETTPWIAWTLRAAEGPQAAAAFNLGGRPADAAVAADSGHWRLAFSTDDPRFGGQGRTPHRLAASEGRLSLPIPPLAGCLFVREIA